MRLTNTLMGIGLLAVTAGLGAYGCSSDTDETTPTPTATCERTDACSEVESACLALEDNAGATTFGLRMAQLNITKPAALSQGLVAQIVGNSIVMKNTACRLNGTGLFSWLLEFDTAAKTLRTGGAPPVTDPNAGYCFVDGPALGATIAPTTLPLEIAADGSFSAQATDQVITVPIFLDAAGEDGVLLPLHAAKLSGGKLDANNNCIGSYNADALDPGDRCIPTAPDTYFTDGANLDGFILVQEAEGVEIATPNTTLCGLLAGDVDTETVGGQKQCTKDAEGNVIFKGDWCSTTNAAATADCADAFSLGATFAASAVKINGSCN